MTNFCALSNLMRSLSLFYNLVYSTSPVFHGPMVVVCYDRVSIDFPIGYIFLLPAQLLKLDLYTLTGCQSLSTVKRREHHLSRFCNCLLVLDDNRTFGDISPILFRDRCDSNMPIEI